MMVKLRNYMSVNDDRGKGEVAADSVTDVANVSI
jgi:hypothetical protein